MKPPYTRTARNRNFFLCRQVPFRTGITQHPEDCKGFPLNTGFCYAHMPFNTVFTAYTHVQRLLDLKAVLLS